MKETSCYIGTSGYSYPHWAKGVFYPKGLNQDKWLEFYCEHFDSVELNVTFYRLPQQKAFASWYKRTPKGFIFAVKGSRFITHIKKLSDIEQPLQLFFKRVEALKEKAAVILWQFAPSFKKDEARLVKFLAQLKKYKGYRHAFEFRHQSWFLKEVDDALASHNCALVCADYPDFAKELHPTDGFCYIRRHGAGAGLYSGCYSEAQLRKDAKILTKENRAKRDVFIYFNNDAYGWAVKNAHTLKDMLNRKQDRPASS